MVGKDPHRIEGKKGADEWHFKKLPARATKAEPLHLAGPEREIEPAPDLRGGERPNVPSRIAGANDAREAREDDED